MEARQIGRFRILSEHARGGMGDLWRAQDDTLNRAVALKLLRPERLQDNEALTRFRREAMAIARLKHDHIAALYEFGDDAELPYLAMEWVEGQSLEERLRSGPIPWEQAIDTLAQLLDALDYAHGQGVVHRDIKPANLMLGPSGLTVVDFGLASLVAEASVTETGPLYGTPLYMAPEMAHGGAVDGRADLYSAALVLFEMLTGKPAFGPGSVVQIIAQQINAPRPILSEHSPGLPIALDAVLVKALAVDPAQRYASGAEFLKALQSTRPQPAKAQSRWPLAVAAGLLAAGVAAMLSWKPPLRPPPVSILQRAWSQPAPYAPWLIQDNRVLLNLPDVLLALGEENGQMVWRSPQTSAARLLLNTEAAVLRLGADGNLEALKGVDGKQLWKIPVNEPVLQGALSSDEELLLCSSNHLLAIDPEAGQEDWSIRIPAQAAGLPPVGNEKLVMLAGEKQRFLTAYRYADSKLAWRNTLPTQPTQLWLGEAGLVAGCQDGQVLAFAPATGRKTWETEGISGQPVVALEGDDDWLVAAWQDGELAGLDCEGYEAWKQQLGETPVGLSLQSGRLLVTGTTRLTCLDVAKGRQLWQTKTASPCQSAARWLTPDRVVVPLKEELVVYQVAPPAPP